MNAIVSSPAGNSAAQRSPERMAAIGRVFENQGKFAQAKSMYRKALSTDPGNKIATQRLHAIADRSSQRSFESSPKTQSATSLIAMADSLNSSAHKPRRLGARPAQPVVEPARIAPVGVEKMVASLAPPAVPPTPAALPTQVDLNLAENLTELAPVETASELTLSNPGWQLDEFIPEALSDAEDIAISFAPAMKASAVETPEISTVVFEGDELSVATIATETDSWTSTNRTASLDDVLAWSDSPADNTDNLLFALTSGENDSVKAFAATLLTECPTDVPEVNAALRHVGMESSPILRVSSRDTLIQRGYISDGIVNDLLELLTVSDADVQSQAAASLRNVAGTEWASQCVTQLTHMLSAGESQVKAVAAATLGDFGADATSSRSVLMDAAANSPSELTRAAAELALNRIPVADLTLPPVEMTDGGLNQPTLSVDGYLPIVE